MTDPPMPLEAPRGAVVAGPASNRTAWLEAMQENRGFISSAQDAFCRHLHTETEEPAGSLLAEPRVGPEEMHGAIVASRG